MDKEPLVGGTTTGDDDARRRGAMSTPAKENARADAGTVKTPSSVRARSIGGGVKRARERGGRVWVMWMDFKCDATNE